MWEGQVTRGGFDRIRVEDRGRKVRKEYFGTQQSDPELQGPSAPVSCFIHRDTKEKRASNSLRATRIRMTIGILLSKVTGFASRNVYMCSGPEVWRWSM